MKCNHKEICEYCEDQGIAVLTADGFEDALIGITEFSPGREQLAVYDMDKCIEILMTRDGMTEEDAIEHFEYNVVGTGGEKIPLFI